MVKLFTTNPIKNGGQGTSRGIIPGLVSGEITMSSKSPK